MIKFYQLVCFGSKVATDGPNKIYSKKIFKTSDAAERYKPLFIELCCTPIDEYDMLYLDRNHSIVCRINELEVAE